MNTSEQRTHRTVTEALDKRVSDVETVTARLLDQDVAMMRAGKALEQRVAQCEDRASILAEELATLTERVKHLDDRSNACRRILIRGFLGRLRWIFHPQGAKTAEEVRAER